LGGQFNDALTLGNIELSSLESNNVYIAYLKDDTWLHQSELLKEQAVLYPNPFQHSFKVTAATKYKYLKVYNYLGELLQISPISTELGNSWKPGIYTIQLVDEFGIIQSQKVVKIH